MYQLYKKKIINDFLYFIVKTKNFYFDLKALRFCTDKRFQTVLIFKIYLENELDLLNLYQIYRTYCASALMSCSNINSITVWASKTRLRTHAPTAWSVGSRYKDSGIFVVLIFRQTGLFALASSRDGGHASQLVNLASGALARLLHGRKDTSSRKRKLPAGSWHAQSKAVLSNFYFRTLWTKIL